MARPIWTGVISFGLVAVPVAMHPATREHEVSFHQFERDTTDRIRYQRVNERTGKEVEFDDIVKGADVGGGDYVMIEPDELADIAPGRSKSLEIHQFVDLAEIDPIYFQKTYYLVPGNEETTKTYALLRDALDTSGRAGIATLVMRGKEYLACIRVDNGLMVLETMFFADEVRDPKEFVDRVPARAGARQQELRMAEQLVDSLTAPWKPEEYRDTYTDRVNDLIKAKQKGGEVSAAAEAPAPTNVVDLLSVLRRSVEDARAKRAAPAKKAVTKKAAAKKAPAKKTTAKRTTAKKSPAKRASAKKAA
ncbi:MAG: Ku protein [Streptomycetaceae bacterium]|nr:Ku protein [Streptomycetaceae bacterium]